MKPRPERQNFFRLILAFILTIPQRGPQGQGNGWWAVSPPAMPSDCLFGAPVSPPPVWPGQGSPWTWFPCCSGCCGSGPNMPVVPAHALLPLFWAGRMSPLPTAVFFPDTPHPKPFCHHKTRSHRPPGDRGSSETKNPHISQCLSKFPTHLTAPTYPRITCEHDTDRCGNAREGGFGRFLCQREQQVQNDTRSLQPIIQAQSFDQSKPNFTPKTGIQYRDLVLRHTAMVGEGNPTWEGASRVVHSVAACCVPTMPITSPRAKRGICAPVPCGRRSGPNSRCTAWAPAGCCPSCCRAPGRCSAPATRRRRRGCCPPRCPAGAGGGRAGGWGAAASEWLVMDQHDGRGRPNVSTLFPLR